MLGVLRRRWKPKRNGGAKKSKDKDKNVSSDGSSDVISPPPQQRLSRSGRDNRHVYPEADRSAASPLTCSSDFSNSLPCSPHRVHSPTSCKVSLSSNPEESTDNSVLDSSGNLWQDPKEMSDEEKYQEDSTEVLKGSEIMLEILDSWTIDREEGLKEEDSAEEKEPAKEKMDMDKDCPPEHQQNANTCSNVLHMTSSPEDEHRTEHHPNTSSSDDLREEIEREKMLRSEAEARLRDVKIESEHCKARLVNLQEEFHKMEDMVKNLLQFKFRIDQLKHEKNSLTLAYESKLRKYQSCIVNLEKENFLLLNELKSIKIPGNEHHEDQDQSLSRILLERLRLLEQENSSLVLENEQQRLQYEHCLDDVANQVVQALLAQKALREECVKLQRRVQDLEEQNHSLTLIFKQGLVNCSESGVQESNKCLDFQNAIKNPEQQQGHDSPSHTSQSEDSSESLPSICSDYSLTSSGSGRNAVAQPGQAQLSSPPQWLRDPLSMPNSEAWALNFMRKQGSPYPQPSQYAGLSMNTSCHNSASVLKPWCDLPSNLSEKSDCSNFSFLGDKHEDSKLNPHFWRHGMHNPNGQGWKKNSSSLLSPHCDGWKLQPPLSMYDQQGHWKDSSLDNFELDMSGLENVGVDDSISLSSLSLLSPTHKLLKMRHKATATNIGQCNEKECLSKTCRACSQQSHYPSTPSDYFSNPASGSSSDQMHFRGVRPVRPGHHIPRPNTLNLIPHLMGSPSRGFYYPALERHNHCSNEFGNVYEEVDLPSFHDNDVDGSITSDLSLSHHIDEDTDTSISSASNQPKSSHVNNSKSCCESKQNEDDVCTNTVVRKVHANCSEEACKLHALNSKKQESWANSNPCCCTSHTCCLNVHKPEAANSCCAGLPKVEKHPLGQRKDSQESAVTRSSPSAELPFSPHGSPVSIGEGNKDEGYSTMSSDVQTDVTVTAAENTQTQKENIDRSQSSQSPEYFTFEAISKEKYLQKHETVECGCEQKLSSKEETSAFETSKETTVLRNKSTNSKIVDSTKNDSSDDSGFERRSTVSEPSYQYDLKDFEISKEHRASLDTKYEKIFTLLTPQGFKARNPINPHYVTLPLHYSVMPANLSAFKIETAEKGTLTDPEQQRINTNPFLCEVEELVLNVENIALVKDAALQLSASNLSSDSNEVSTDTTTVEKSAAENTKNKAIFRVHPLSSLPNLFKKLGNLHSHRLHRALSDSELNCHYLLERKPYRHHCGCSLVNKSLGSLRRKLPPLERHSSACDMRELLPDNFSPEPIGNKQIRYIEEIPRDSEDSPDICEDSEIKEPPSTSEARKANSLSASLSSIHSSDSNDDVDDEEFGGASLKCSRDLDLSSESGDECDLQEHNSFVQQWLQQEGAGLSQKLKNLNNFSDDDEVNNWSLMEDSKSSNKPESEKLGEASGHSSKGPDLDKIHEDEFQDDFWENAFWSQNFPLTKNPPNSLSNTPVKEKNEALRIYESGDLISPTTAEESSSNKFAFLDDDTLILTTVLCDSLSSTLSDPSTVVACDTLKSSDSPKSTNSKKTDSLPLDKPCENEQEVQTSNDIFPVDNVLHSETTEFKSDFYKLCSVSSAKSLNTSQHSLPTSECEITSHSESTIEITQSKLPVKTVLAEPEKTSIPLSVISNSLKENEKVPTSPKLSKSPRRTSESNAPREIQKPKSSGIPSPKVSPLKSQKLRSASSIPSANNSAIPKSDPSSPAKLPSQEKTKIPVVSSKRGVSEVKASSRSNRSSRSQSSEGRSASRHSSKNLQRKPVQSHKLRDSNVTELPSSEKNLESKKNSQSDSSSSRSIPAPRDIRHKRDGQKRVSEKSNAERHRQPKRELREQQKNAVQEKPSLSVADKISQLNALITTDTEKYVLPSFVAPETKDSHDSSLERKKHLQREERALARSARNKEGCCTSWVHVEADIDLTDPRARANLLDCMMASSSSSGEEGDEEIIENHYNQRLHALHRIRRHRKRATGKDAVISFISRGRASIIDREDFFYRYGEKEKEAVACFDFLNDLSTSPSDGSNEVLNIDSVMLSPVENNGSLMARLLLEVPQGLSQNKSDAQTNTLYFDDNQMCYNKQMTDSNLSSTTFNSENGEGFEHVSFSDSCAESYSSSTHSLNLVG